MFVSKVQLTRGKVKLAPFFNEEKMSNKNKATSNAIKIARHLKRLEDYHQQRIYNNHAVFFAMQVKSKDKDITFQDYMKEIKAIKKKD